MAPIPRAKSIAFKSQTQCLLAAELIRKFRQHAQVLSLVPDAESVKLAEITAAELWISLLLSAAQPSCGPTDGARQQEDEN